MNSVPNLTAIEVRDAFFDAIASNVPEISRTDFLNKNSTGNALNIDQLKTYIFQQEAANELARQERNPARQEGNSARQERNPVAANYVLIRPGELCFHCGNKGQYAKDCTRNGRGNSFLKRKGPPSQNHHENKWPKIDRGRVRGYGRGRGNFRGNSKPTNNSNNEKPGNPGQYNAQIANIEKLGNSDEILNCNKLTKFLADSGTTKHMSYSKLIFSKLDESKQIRIKCTNKDKSAKIESEGVEQVALNSINVGKQFTLDNVICAESLSENLLSLRKFVDQGLRTYLNNKKLISLALFLRNFSCLAFMKTPTG